MTQRQPVLILGAGIVGASVARDLALNGVPVWVVDRQDIAFGATAKSSRLIHGGLRYLEYGDFGLVKESLVERERLLSLAPQFVRPLRFFIPVRSRWGGWTTAVGRLVGRHHQGHSERGLWLVRTGLSLYDRYARASQLPRHQVHRVGSSGGARHGLPTVGPARTDRLPQIDSAKYRWLCSYSDAQMVFPERYTLALLHDARTLARDAGIDFRVLTNADVAVEGKRFTLRDRLAPTAAEQTVEPSVVINATGPWGDQTLEQLRIRTSPLLRPTKGSHLVTDHRALCQATAGHAVYSETSDGRFVFILPMGECVLVGTTELPWDSDPALARADREELQYLFSLVSEVFAHIKLSESDVLCHYSGVRPLARSDATSATATSRRHHIELHEAGDLPVVSLVGGKLTTARALAEEATDLVLARFGVTRSDDTRNRMVPGGEDFPVAQQREQQRLECLAAESGLSVNQVQFIWQRYGTRTAKLLADVIGDPHDVIADTIVPRSLVDWMIQQEWARTVDDLVERRLVLVPPFGGSTSRFATSNPAEASSAEANPGRAGVTEATLQDLARLLVQHGHLPEDAVATAVARSMARLRQVYGLRLAPWSVDGQPSHVPS